VKLPELAAERGIGPAIGTYAYTGTPGRSPSAGGPRLSPQMMEAPINDDQAAAILANMKNDPCRDGRVPCRGAWFRDEVACCDPATEICDKDDTGRPFCRARAR